MRGACGVACLVALGLLEPAGAALAGPRVIGGSDAPPGMWPDAAAILYSGQMRCSGTLVAPQVVLTAGHCADPSLGPTPDHVRVGASSLDGSGGETIAVDRAVVFPDWQTTIDMTVLVLAAPASEPPRPIATGWARPAIRDGASVDLVGYGAIDANGSEFVPALQQATTTIADVGCTTEPGCNAGAMPDGELGAGGMGVDTCPGDSGGPLYLPTPFGTFLAGTTSRGYATDQTACGMGGIYERPDHVIDWIEQSAGSPVARGPEPELEAPLVAPRGGGVVATIAADDPATSFHRFAIATQPAHGTAAVHDDGVVHVCIAADAPAGSDAITVTITADDDATRSIAATFAIAIEDADGSGCEVAVFDGATGGGGCAVGGEGSIGLGLGLGLVLGRRRRG
jgi:secreted trypsin-like serine protease